MTEMLEHNGTTYDVMAAGILSKVYREEAMKHGCKFSTEPGEEAIEHCTRWLKLHAAPGMKVNPHTYSYGLKHVVEKWCGTYIPNGAFILAAKRMGIRVIPEGPRSPNALFCMSYPLKARQVSHGS